MGKTKADDEPLSIITVLDSNGLDDAIWCLPSVVGHDKEISLYGVWSARQVQHLMTDPRRIAIQKNISSASSAARDIAWAAVQVASWAAAGLAAWALAGATAWVAAWVAVGVTVVIAAGIVAGAAAWDAARAAARTAARASARAASGYEAGSAARAAARAEVEATKEKQLRKICAEIEILDAETA